MTTEREREPDQATDADGTHSGAGAGTDERSTDRKPDWGHRDHPTFTALAGFFTGLGFLLLVPALFAGVLGLIFDLDTAERLFPFVLVMLLVPISLAIWPRARRFGLYMLLGMVTTAVVVGGVAAVVLWFLVTYRS